VKHRRGLPGHGGKICAHAVFDELRQGFRDIKFISDPAAGEVRIGCSESLIAFLVLVIESLLKKNPRMRFHVRQVHWPTVGFPELHARTIDLTLARLHPVLHTMRAHKGTDFAAPIGTPVRATADGVVTFVGQQTGYGNVIMLKHDGRYSTVYAHLSRFAPDTRDGARIHQGETIGYVGQTGWATGPHLHYELRVDGEPRDPLTVALPMATPVTDQQRPAFAAAIAPLAGELAVVRELPVSRLVAAN